MPYAKYTLFLITLMTAIYLAAGKGKTTHILVALYSSIIFD